MTDLEKLKELEGRLRTYALAEDIFGQERHDLEVAADLLASLASKDAENAELRKIVSGCAEALGNGAVVAPECSLDFMGKLPGEIDSFVARLRAEVRNEMRIAAEHLADKVLAEQEARGEGESAESRLATALEGNDDD